MKKFVSMTLILCMVLSLMSFGTIMASAEGGIINYTVYNTFDESSADGLYDGLFTAGYNYLTDKLLAGSVNGVARWGHTVATIGKSVMQQHISIAGKTVPVIVEYTAYLKGGSKYYSPQYGGNAGGTGSSSYNGFDSKNLSGSALSIDRNSGATKFMFVIDPVACKITPYKNGQVVEEAIVTFDAGQTDVYLGHCFDTAYSVQADVTDPAMLEKYFDLYYMMVYDEGATPDFEVKSYTSTAATVQFNTPVSLDTVSAMTVNGVQVTGAEDVSQKNEQANLYKVTYSSLSGGSHTFALAGTSLSGRAIDAKKEFNLVSVVNPEATEKTYVDVQFGCAVTDITAVGTNILPLGEGEKYEEEVENCYRIKLTGLDYEQDYEFTVSAESAAYGTITQTLTAKVRAPKAYANVLGVYKDGYSASEEPIDPLENAKLAAAVAIANETATPYEFKVVFAIVNPDGEVVGYGDDMVLDHDARIATLCAGYGDGYPRCLSNGKGKVGIRGKLAQVVGLVCMDQMMVEVTDIPDAQVGDAVELLGGAIPYMTYADWANTNRNEAITILSRRPQRVYWQGGRIVTVIDSMLDERRDFE